MQTVAGVVQSIEESEYTSKNGGGTKAIVTIVVEVKEHGDKYPKVVAAKAFSDKAVTAARNLKAGDVVVLDGDVSSKKSEKGYWNSDFSAVFIKVLDTQPF